MMTDNLDEMRQQAMNEPALELSLVALQEPSRGDDGDKRRGRVRIDNAKVTRNGQR